MPKLQLSPSRAQAEIVHKNIVSRGAYFGCRTDRDFGKRLAINATSFGNRRANPQLWRLDELIRATVVFKCTLAWLVTDHGGEMTITEGQAQ